jgi:drug/metabolite transporter (DMT)-like permease
MSIPPKAALAAAITVVFWGSAFPGIEAGLDAYEPGQLALLRYLFASATIGAVAVTRSFRLPHTRDLPGIAVLGTLGFTIYHGALNYGQVSVTAGSASFLVQTAPIFATLLAVVFLGERLSLKGWIGIAVSFSGAGLIAVGEADGLRFEPGAGLVLGAAFAGASYFTLQKTYLDRYTPLEITAYAMWVGTLIMALTWGAALPAQVAAAPADATLAVAYIGVLPGALAYVTYAYVLSHLPVAQTTSLLYLVPLVALPVAWVWRGEVPTATAVAGGLLALAGVALVQHDHRTSAESESESEERT